MWKTAIWRSSGASHHKPWFLGGIFTIFLMTATIVVGLDDSIITPVDLSDGTGLDLQNNLCLPNQFMCKDGLSCIDKSMVCDYSEDCYDRSDEESCPSEIPCREGTFQCKISKKCIPSGWLCDGAFDCKIPDVTGLLTEDLSDEEDARCISDKICQPNQFKCSNGVTCIEISQLCDGNVDVQCPDKEHKFCDNSTVCSTANCLYGCKPSPLEEALCFCPIGQEHDGKGCIESNECMEAGACDQHCELNQQKKKMCSCADGYQSVESKCLANNVPDGSQGEPVILFQDASSIKWISLNGTKPSWQSTYISPNHTGILGTDFDHLNDTVCYISHSDKSHVMKCGLSNRLSASWNKREPYIFSLQDVHEIRFDHISTNWYFLDPELEMIFVCNEDLDLCKIIIDSNLSKPRGIALDPAQGYMFFTVWGRSGPKVVRALLDGTGQETIVSKKIVYPQGITLDVTKKVYFVDKFLDAIISVNYDGTNRKTIHRGVQHLQDITVFQNDLFFISMKDDSINKIDKFSPSNYSTLVTNLTKPLSLKVYHRVRQPRVKHPCMTHGGNNPCQDFCFPLWKKGKPIAQCGCREGFVLKSNTTCVMEDITLLIVYLKSNGVIKSASLKNGQVRQFNNGVMIPVVKKGSYSALAFDYKNRTVFYSDIANFRILYKSMNQTESNVFADKDIGHIGSIAVDSAGRNLIWVDETIPAIYVSQMNNSTIKKLLVHSDLKRPGSIALSPETGTMFWATLPTSIAKSDGAIETAWMDGSNRQTIVTGLGNCIGLTIADNKYLYWIDTSKLVVQRIQLSNHLQIETLLRINDSLKGEPTSFSYHNGTFYIAVEGKVMKAAMPRTLMDPKNVTFTVVAGEGDISEFLIFDATTIQRGKNKCGGHSCQDLCLATAGKAGMTCACREGYILNKDGRSCRVDSSYKDPLKCGPDQFKCVNLPKCISQALLCNNQDDCGDNSDEDSKHCDRSYIKQGFCAHNSYHCPGSGLCIPFSYVCNGKIDCPGGLDEVDCSNGTIHCSEFEFECKITKRCIPKSWVCDRTKDCSVDLPHRIIDESDEHEDCIYPECSELQFKCFNSSSCIPLESVCDGIKDCGNGEDEHPTIDCDTHCQNRSDMFYCELDNKCIELDKRCDGLCHCSDAKDEINCLGKVQPNCAMMATFATHDFECDFDVGPVLSKDECFNVSCGRHAFRCHDGKQCIPLKARCNGNKDCVDGTDEQNCPHVLVPCAFPSRLCDNGNKCVPITQVCNKNSGCFDKDKAKLCSEKPCAAANCSHQCATVPEGHLCYCPTGKHVDPKNASNCIDNHPCDTFGTCSQLCWKYGESQYECLCHPGYALREDGITCSSVSNESPYLVFSNRHELRGLYLNSTSIFQSLISNLRNSIALDFYYQNGKYDIFWSDVVDDKIYRGSLVSGSLINIQIVIEKGLATAEGLAVDWIGENLYWVESNLDQIEVAKLNGSYRQTLISGDMVSPRSIAVDPNVGLLFWSDWQTEQPRIERASMGGGYRKKIFNVGSSGEGAWPNGLCLDYLLQRIFWVDARLDSIHTVKYNGEGYLTVLQDNLAVSHPFSITLFDSTIVWTDWRSNSVMTANKFTGGNVTTIHKTYTQPFDVKILHPTRQPRKIMNPCGKNNGNCSHLCLLSVNGTNDCGCPHLMTLSTTDNRTCISNERMLLFSRLNEIRAVYFDKPYYHAAPPISYPLIVMPANLHFVARDKQVYWSDSQSGETKRSSLINPTIYTLIDAAAGKPLAMGVDWVSNLIFIVVQTSSHNSISVTNLEGQFFSTVIQGKQQELKNVNSLAVNPYRAQLFWPEGVGSGDFKIFMASMTGQRKLLSNSRDNPALENPASLSYDFTSERLYWVNLNTAIIQYYDFHSKEIKSISFGGDIKPHVITVYGNSILFASEKHDAILKGDKTNGGADGFEFVRNYTENIYSIKVYDPDEQNGTNSCAVNSGGCQQLCIPLIGKRICKCALGYTLDDKDPTKCRPIEPVLVFSDSQGIKGISPIVNQTEDLLVPIPLVSFATDLDVFEEYLYWLDSEKGKISRIKRDGTGKQTILSDLTAVSGICIDYIAQNLYWANPKDSYIEVSHLNGSSHHVLITEGLDKPISLAIDPVQGLLFFTDIVKGQIQRATLDGLNRKIIADDVKASEITVDLENQRIYWCTSNDNIESSNYDGSNKKQVYSEALSTSQLHSPIVDKGFLYWVDIGETGGTIMSLSLKNFSMVQAVRKDLGVTIKDLSIFSKGRQIGSNGCNPKLNPCDDLCFWNGTHANCVCAHGKLGKDGKKCEPFDAFIAYSRVNSIAMAHITKEITPNDPYPPIQSSEHIRNAIGLAYDYKRNTLFYSDVQLGTINRVHFNGTGYGVVAEKQGSVEGLYFEASHSDLYWTCSNDASINRINPHLPNAKVQKIIKLNANDKPRGIAIDPCESRVYFTNWDSSRPSIQRAYLSGYGIESIITTDIRMPNSLALDQASRKLYWVDARLDKAEKSDLDGSNRVVVARHNPKHAFSLAIYQDYIIWTDWVRLAVLRANKYTGENVEILRQDIPKPMGLVVVSPQDVVCTSNPCNVLNGGCQDICIYNENHQVVCECGPGKLKLSDGNCVAKSNLDGVCDGWTCKNGQCVTEKDLCNGIQNCDDNSDEDASKCGINECLIPGLPNPCFPHKCIDKPIGFECNCNPGYELSEFNKSNCEVVDECLKKRPCSQKCESSIGSFKCSCVNDYVETNGVCKAKSSIPVDIMFTNQYYIRLVTGNMNNGSLISQNLTNAVALDYHWDFGCIYWSDVTALGSSIKRSCAVTNRSEDIGQVEMNEQVLHHSISSPDGIAVDWVAHNLYWCDKGTNTIEVSRLDGRYRKAIISGLQDPRAIVLDPFRGYLYWSDWGEEPIIGKAGMDGSRVQTLISENLGWPNALTISYETEEIWWADAREDYIGVSDLFGKNQRRVHSRAQNPSANLHHIFSITTFEDYIYWSDWETKSVERCHKYTGEGQISITKKLIHRPMDVKVWHPYRQRPLLNNPCGESNGGCASLCLLTPEGGHICACPENFILNDDLTSCTSNCTTAQFVCEKTSRCIPKWWKCDSQCDCGGAEIGKKFETSGNTCEDEPESCPPFNCEPGHIQFDNQTCLYPTSICDGRIDSPQGSDEYNCNNHTCLQNYYKCQWNGTVQSKCIPSQHRCDGNKDCAIGDDEENCAPTKCPSTQFQCASSGKCIQTEWVCDLEDDCGDKDDELNCANRSCPEDKFRCNSGKCIPRTWRCDSERDCSNGEDEDPTECEQHASCEKNPSYYQCKNSHKCIPSRWKCDYEVDCPSHADDEDNCVPRNCSESEFQCGDGRCIHSRFLCDGSYECSDMSDESNCHVSCNSLTEFVCTSPPTCLPTKFVCDGESDCLDNSDEDPSKCGNSTFCEGFRCDKSNECIPYVWLCDGTSDCLEGEDEQMCDKPISPHTSLCSATKNEFQCSDMTCISISKVCDKIHDCSDDELGCPDCPFRSCSQQCSKKKHADAFICECVQGYQYEVNRTRCSAEGDPATLIIASEDHLLRLNKPHDVDHVDLLISTTPTKIDSVDFFIDEDKNTKLFWSSRTNKAIQMMYITSTSSEGNSVSSRNRRSTSSTEIVKGLDDPRGISIDWLARVLFYIDAGHKTISASSLDGKIRMVILRRLTEPFDIAVDPSSGRIYWSDWTDKCIEYASEDGSGRKTIIHGLRPTGLAIDHPGRRLYWTDIRDHAIMSTTLEGKDKVTIQRFTSGTGGWLKPFKLDVFEDTLYFTNYSSNKINKISKFGIGNVTDITYGVVKASDVVLIQEHKQIKDSVDYCATVPCPSPGLCLRNGSTSAACFCSNTKPLSSGTTNDGSAAVIACSNLKALCELKCNFQGKCMVGSNNRPYCKCQKGYSGVTCEKNSYDYNNENLPPDFNQNTTSVDLCLNRICRNGGKCEVIEQIAYCRCPISWIGINCEIEASFRNPCVGFCLHNGLCLLSDFENSKECKCVNGRTGSRCELNPICTNFYCFNGGTCMANPDSRLLPTCKCPSGFYGMRCDRPDIQGKVWSAEEDSGLTWILVAVALSVAVSVASCSGCIAYLVMRRKGRPFMHRRMQDSGTVEISNPMFLKDEGDEDQASEPSLIFDSDKVLLQGTNFANPVYETMYKEGETSTSNDEKKGLLQDHPLADPLA